MFVYFAISIGLTVFYAVIMTYYRIYWDRTEVFLPPSSETLPSVTVIIPVRNEQESIGNLLKDLLQQDYPNEYLEIIVVDDHSEDNTAEMVRKYTDERVRLISLNEFVKNENITSAYKKKAIEIGVQFAKGELIMTTDGDCRINPRWVKTMVGIWSQSGAKILTGAVVMTGTKTLFQRFQALDFLGMMGITAAMLKMKIYNMANGANLLYEKSAFESVGGFHGIDHIASGDDMLLMYKIAQKYNGKVAYAKHLDAVVETKTMDTVKAFLQQRFRWTAKSKDYQDYRMTCILGFVFLFVCTLLFNSLFIFWSTKFIQLALLQWIVKMIVDYRLLKSTSTYYNRQDLMRTFFSSQIFHVLYIVGVGSLGNLLKFEWKGRKGTK